MMVIGSCQIELRLPGNSSLKGKRRLLKPIQQHLRRKFNVAAAETAHNDLWQTAEIGIVTLANDAGYVHSVLEEAVHWIELHHPEVQVIDWQIDIF